MINGIKRRGIVGKDGKIEIQTSEFPEGTIVEVIVLVEQNPVDSTINPDSPPQDTTDYLLSNEANRRHLMESIDQAETTANPISFTAEEWDEKYNIHP